METTRKIWLTVHRAVGLKPLGGRIGPMRPYANIYLAGENIDNSAPQKTPTDKQGDTDPCWDYIMVIGLPPEAIKGKRLYSLICEIKHDSSLPDRLIGIATIPIKDLLIDRKNSRYLVMKKGKGHGRIVLSHELILHRRAAGGGGGGAAEDVPHADTPIPVPATTGPPPAAAAAGGEDGAHADTPIPVPETTAPPAELLSAQAPLLPAPATNSKPLVAMNVVAASTTVVDNVVNTTANLTDFSR